MTHMVDNIMDLFNSKVEYDYVLRMLKSYFELKYYLQHLEEESSTTKDNRESQNYSLEKYAKEYNQFRRMVNSANLEECIKRFKIVSTKYQNIKANPPTCNYTCKGWALTAIGSEVNQLQLIIETRNKYGLLKSLEELENDVNSLNLMLSKDKKNTDKIIIANFYKKNN